MSHTMTFEYNGRTYAVDRIYSFNGEIRIDCHYRDQGQAIGRTWRLTDLTLPQINSSAAATEAIR
jgi:hypothetical protein